MRRSSRPAGRVPRLADALRLGRGARVAPRRSRAAGRMARGTSSASIRVAGSQPGIGSRHRSRSCSSSRPAASSTIPRAELAAVRAALAWYPDDVWLWLLACQWRRLDQEEPFVGRAAEVGDELGSRVVAARLVRDVMRLAFLLERRYAPYSKWLGSAFAQLEAAATLRPAPARRALRAELRGARDRARRGGRGARTVAQRNRSDAPVETTVRLFHTRPFRVLGSARFVDACLERVTDPWLKSLPLVGAIDQYVDSVDVLSDPRAFAAAASFYD